MRILRVAQTAYPDVKGGGAYHVHAMSRDQAAMGHDVTVLTIHRNPDKPQFRTRDGYTVVRYDPTVNLLGNDISTGVAQYLKDAGDFDVIHAHSHLYFSTNLAALKAFLGDIPLAITNHGLYSQTAPEWVFELYLKTIGRWTFNQADVVFCYTEEDRERVQEYGVSTRIEVVSNGIDIERFTPHGRASEKIDHRGPVILFVGRLVEGKRPQDAVKAISKLSNEKDIKLYLIGDGPMRSDLEKIADKKIEFLGQLAYDEMCKIYRSGDVLVLPSRAEGLPRTVLEAMSSGIPVVVSDLEQVTPVVNGSGVTVPVGDVDGFASGIDTMIHEDYDEPRAQIEGSFDWAETVGRTTDILGSIL
ncbi:glycosyltransferase family 4 protein [Natronoarchaeum sp. GCM10025703]|uniref:glycosyltransferase family 4 protein n=1 Tax=Natronoarchaeum sp. GCM10025703 TaxID=3252685 RepID=UPI00360E703A